MQLEFLDALVCPLDHAPLRLARPQQGHDSIESGTLVCTACGESFSIKDGVPHMLSSRLPGIDLKLGEVRGWVDKARREEWYGAQDDLDLALPYVVEKLGWDPEGARGWAATRYSFEHLLTRYVKPGMRVLEVGSAKTWAGHYFLERGCTYTASDILDDPFIGVGRSRFYNSRFGPYEAIVADAEALPFREGWFDLVFGIQVLHHALDLTKMLSEMARLTAPGGYVVGLNEGVRALWASPTAEQQDGERRFGINEHVHTLGTYLDAFRRSGLRIVELERAVGDDALIAPRLKWALDVTRSAPGVGESMATWLLFNLIHRYDGVSMFAAKLNE